MLNFQKTNKILQQCHENGAKVVAITKYLPIKGLKQVQKELKHPALVGIGENRAERVWELQQHGCDMVSSHFVGNLQSRTFKTLAHLGCFLHSVGEMRHIEKLNKLYKAEKKELNYLLQVNISNEVQKNGINPKNVGEMLEKINEKGLPMPKGISGMGRGVFTEKEKHAEFVKLQRMREKWLPKGVISAGTSKDWQIALQYEVDWLRLGRVLWYYEEKKDT